MSRGEVIWLNGALRCAADPVLMAADRGVLLADGVFETLRLRDHGPAYPFAHLARLRVGAAVLGIPVPLPDADLLDALGRTAWANDRPNGVLRLTLTRGPGPRGLLPGPNPAPTLMIAAFPPAAPLDAARVLIAGCTRRNEFSPLSRIKSLGYADSVLARREAAAAGADDALLRNTAGRLCCATAATLLLRGPDGRWVTPPVSDGALPGTARARLLAVGLVTEAPIDDAALAAAGSIALCNALGLRPVRALGDRPLDAAPSDLAALGAFC